MSWDRRPDPWTSVQKFYLKSSALNILSSTSAGQLTHTGLGHKYIHERNKKETKISKPDL